MKIVGQNELKFMNHKYQIINTYKSHNLKVTTKFHNVKDLTSKRSNYLTRFKSIILCNMS